VQRTIGADDRIQRLRRRACRYSTLVVAPARMEWGLLSLNGYRQLSGFGYFARRRRCCPRPICFASCERAAA
jgi:hypothetical protein